MLRTTSSGLFHSSDHGMKMKPHPFANIFPLLEGEPFDNLVADIKANGLLQAITIHGNMILDGRNRLRACEAAGIEPRFVEYGGGDPLSFVLSQNLHRRHLDESQRAMIAAKLANMPAHRPADKSANLRTSQSEAAAKLNVSERTVSSAVGVRAYATPELIEAVEQGKIKVSVAEALLGAPKAAQRQAVAAPDRAHVLAKQHRRRISRTPTRGQAAGMGPTRDFRRDLRRPPVAVRAILARDRARSRRRQPLFDDDPGRHQGAAAFRPSPPAIACCSCGRRNRC